MKTKQNIETLTRKNGTKFYLCSYCELEAFGSNSKPTVEQHLEDSHFDTDELKDGVEDGISPKQSMHFFRITRKEYDRVLNSKTNIYGKISKSAPAYEGDDKYDE